MSLVKTERYPLLLLVPFQHIGSLGIEVCFGVFAFLFYCILLFFSVNGNGKEKKEVVVLWQEA